MNFNQQQARRLGDCLVRLSHHSSTDAFAVTGGVAIHLHLTGGLPRYSDVLTDVDLLASGPTSVSPSVTEAFLVSHFHLPHPGYPKFLIQLIDVDSRLRVDIFPGSPDVIRRASYHDLCGTPRRVLGPEALLDHKISLLATASERLPVDEKHYDDAVLLGRLIGRNVPEVPAAFLCQGEYSSDTSVSCERCARSESPEFPLSPKQQIRDVLGYV